MDTHLDEQIGALAGHLHAATAQFIDTAIAFDESDQWAGIGMQSCAHWLTVATGIDLWTAREMLRVGHALRELPRIHAAFAEGRLSFDKVRAVTHVATPADEPIWLDIALEASGSQLARICRQFRGSIAVDDPDRAAMQRARRRVVSWWLDEDGMLALYATLPPEEGRLVLTAIESAVVGPVALRAVEARGEAGDSTGGSDPCADGEADHPYGARRAGVGTDAPSSPAPRLWLPLSRLRCARRRHRGTSCGALGGRRPHRAGQPRQCLRHPHWRRPEALNAPLRKSWRKRPSCRLDMPGSAIGNFDHLGWMLEYEDGR